MKNFAGTQNGEVALEYHQITTSTKTIAIDIYAADETRYLHKDNLGSIDTITDGGGNVVERMSYTAFGKRRAGNWNNNNAFNLPALTNRGFTGHEHIDELGLIHMNGRVYDPAISRFLSADPYIQDPYNSQSYNRYSYALNNPLKYTDPSGYFVSWFKKKAKQVWNGIRKHARVIVAAVVAYHTGQWQLIAKHGALAQGAVAGFTGGLIATGNLKGAIKGAIAGGISAQFARYIGHGGTNGGRLFQGSYSGIKTAVAHGVSQGAISQISGSSFKSGFWGGAISSVVGEGLSTSSKEWKQVAKRTAIAATAGGVVAELGGGKFSNGAVSGAFVHLYNREAGNISKALKADSQKDYGWFGRPAGHHPKIGRDGTIIQPGETVSNFIENYIPAGHTFGYNHDSLVDSLTIYGIPDLIANVPTMPAVYIHSVKQEFINSIYDIFGVPVPFQHTESPPQ